MKPRLARRSLRTPWAPNDEEARAYLQERLTLLYKLMFWAYAFLVGSQAYLWQVSRYRSDAPAGQHGVYLLATAGLLLMAGIWRGLLVRRALPMRALLFLDALYATGSGCVLGGCALFAYDYPPSHYITALYAFIALLTRTIIIPSSGPRSLAAGIQLFAPIVTAALVLAFIGTMIVPGPVFVVGSTLLSVVAIVLAKTGSDIIYGLRRQVSAAQQLGAYKLDRKIGEGGMGAVYRAHHIMLRRPTAVKLVLPDLVGADTLERFEREVHHMSQLTHPNTVAVYDYGRSPDGVFYYAMEYLGGGIDLERLVRTHGPQPSGRVAHILAQVCGALSEAHERQIIHRDIKPANIILCERGGMPDVAKVVDYGLVKEVSASGGSSQQLILGTPAYVAPEVITDPGSVGPAADLYALGAVGYFLLTGRRLFEGKTAVEVCIQQVMAVPRRPSEIAAIAIAPELDAIVMRCLEKNPANRYASAAELADALRALPAQSEWDHLRDAKDWWREFRTREHSAEIVATQPTVSVTVDLGHRQ